MKRLVLIVILVGVAGAGSMFVIRAASPAPGGATLTPAPTVPIRGTLTLTTGDLQWHEGACRGIAGFSDLVDGAGVTVKDGKGEVIAVGSLHVDKARSSNPRCVFAFSIDAPDSAFYAVEVSHRGALTYSKADALAGLALTLGD